MVDNSKNTESAQVPASFGGQTYERWRLIKDSMTRYAVIVGGLGVIAAIVLIFFYLLYVVLPLFSSPATSSLAEYSTPEPDLGKTALMDMEEQNEVAARFTDTGRIVFFDTATGKTLLKQAAPIPVDTRITAVARSSLRSEGAVVYGLSDGRAVLLKQKYSLSYQGDKRVITPSIEYPMGEQPIAIDPSGAPLEKIALSTSDSSTVIAAKAGNNIHLIAFKKEQSLFDDNAVVQRTSAVLENAGENLVNLLIDKSNSQLFSLNGEGLLKVYNISDIAAPKEKYQEKIIEAGQSITAVSFLNGDLSLLVGDSAGRVSQWTQVKNELKQLSFKKIRSFKVSDSTIVAIEPEQRRKGFMTVDAAGMIGMYNSTAERELFKLSTGRSSLSVSTLSPRANRLLAETREGGIRTWSINNEHPEVSFKSLWQKVWYESYPKPDYIWQSSSASSDFEPKYSLVPLVFGTLKAAFYAMIVAMPLALMGAIYTAYFMSPRMRQFVKPSIELMGALPTVILGFLAGLWLAPAIEENLSGLFLMLFSLPLAVLTFALVWQYLPNSFRQKIPEGWDAAILIPVMLTVAFCAFYFGTPLEAFLFNGTLRDWLNREYGIGYDQRNALIVGIAMGFAVIPTIFSIAEDAIFSVPKHLTVGSLALGATPWQTMMKVVLFTASPGIFSAVMIGFGRAVGETMIVLMATGNTPVMDFSVFQGLRTLAANVAVEMPESEVDSSHYRVLFLTALVLFVFTFIFNTLAEIIRQRLREKYSSL